MKFIPGVTELVGGSPETPISTGEANIVFLSGERLKDYGVENCSAYLQNMKDRGLLSQFQIYKTSEAVDVWKIHIQWEIGRDTINEYRC